MPRVLSDPNSASRTTSTPAFTAPELLRTYTPAAVPAIVSSSSFFSTATVGGLYGLGSPPAHAWGPAGAAAAGGSGAGSSGAGTPSHAPSFSNAGAGGGAAAPLDAGAAARAAAPNGPSLAAALLGRPHGARPGPAHLASSGSGTVAEDEVGL